ncbi:MAG: hypothetical protein J3K34DRAFT_516223 [Monoraphidium minutum]|nr:MAG: hypothetical protein J3K34DRAFT_516223 [Monoraphidium minutum]
MEDAQAGVPDEMTMIDAPGPVDTADAASMAGAAPGAYAAPAARAHAPPSPPPQQQPSDPGQDEAGPPSSEGAASASHDEQPPQDPELAQAQVEEQAQPQAPEGDAVGACAASCAGPGELEQPPPQQQEQQQLAEQARPEEQTAQQEGQVQEQAEQTQQADQPPQEQEQVQQAAEAQPQQPHSDQPLLQQERSQPCEPEQEQAAGTGAAAGASRRASLLADPGAGGGGGGGEEGGGGGREGDGGGEGGGGGDGGAQRESAETLQRPSAPEPSSYFIGGLRAIDVEVDCGPGVPCRLLRVDIDVSEAGRKPFLGGYRHRGSGATYHHAAAQAAPPAAGSDGCGAAVGGAGGGVARARPARACRETQTVRQAAGAAQTLREAATQMPRPGAVIDGGRDRLVTPRPYVTAGEVIDRRAAAALTVQRFARGMAARRRAAALRAHKEEREEFLQRREAARAADAGEARRLQVERRMHPSRPADFRALEAELGAWRAAEAGRIKGAGLDAGKEREALRLLLAKETRLLQTVDRLRTGAARDARGARAAAGLAAMAAPETWELRNGNKVLVETPATARASALRQLHAGLALPGLPPDERLDVLLHAKWVAKEVDCGLTREIVALIDREADLINRQVAVGRSPATMEGLRRRLSALFLQFCEGPAAPGAGAAAAAPRGGKGSGSGAAAAAAAAGEAFIYAEAERGAARAAPVGPGCGAW